METFLTVTSAFLLGLAIVGTVLYFLAVRKGRRAYGHVIFAFLYVIGATVTSTFALADDGELLQGIRSVVNVMGILAMLTLVARFSHPSLGDVKRIARQDEEIGELREVLVEERERNIKKYGSE